MVGLKLLEPFCALFFNIFRDLVCLELWVKVTSRHVSQFGQLVLGTKDKVVRLQWLTV